MKVKIKLNLFQRVYRDPCKGKGARSLSVRLAFGFSVRRWCCGRQEFATHVWAEENGKQKLKNLSVSVVKLKQSVIISKRNLNIVRPKLSWHTGTAYLYIMGWCPNACPGPDVGCVFFVVWHLHRRSKAYTVSSVACTGS